MAGNFERATKFFLPPVDDWRNKNNKTSTVTKAKNTSTGAIT